MLIPNSLNWAQEKFRKKVIRLKAFEFFSEFCTFSSVFCL
jgi:hypothetical protein